MQASALAPTRRAHTTDAQAAANSVFYEILLETRDAVQRNYQLLLDHARTDSDRHILEDKLRELDDLVISVNRWNQSEINSAIAKLSSLIYQSDLEIKVRDLR